MSEGDKYYFVTFVDYFPRYAKGIFFWEIKMKSFITPSV